MDEGLRRTLDYAWAHREEEATRLLLGKGAEGVDLRRVAQQIEGWQSARRKWPQLALCRDYRYAPRLNREQSSSEATAGYKRSLLAGRMCDDALMADLTGGMGIDTLALASLTQREVAYVERDVALCDLMRHNAEVLGCANVRVHCADSMEWLAQHAQQYDLLYLDPARRDGLGRKVAAFEDCMPNIVEHIELLKSRTRRLLVKASPMMDIDAGATLFGGGVEVHVVSVGGECKELLYLWDAARGEEPLTLHCVATDGKAVRDFAFRREEEQACEGCYAAQMGRYLYEPEASLMKGGPYKLLGARCGVQLLGRNTHLYTSTELREWEWGRRWEVLQELPLNRKAVRAALPEGRAHVVTRNYPVRAEVLQRQLGLAEGGELFVVATTMGQRKVGLLCRSV